MDNFYLTYCRDHVKKNDSCKEETISLVICSHENQY